MTDAKRPSRRRLLALVGGGFAATAGCLDRSGTDATDDPSDDASDEPEATEGSTEGVTGATDSTTDETTESDGPEDDPSTDEPTPEAETDDGSATGYETETFEGVAVPLVPVEEVYEWYQAGDVHFVDARSEAQYERAHISGAVLSPAPDGLEEDDPVEDFGREERIVTYCGCPHTLAGSRASTLLQEGYEEVYAIDEGFYGWTDRGYPTEGTNDVETTYTIRGQTPTTGNGATVLAKDRETGQLEAALVEPDGGYELELRFAELTPDSVIVVETPDYRTAAELSALLEGEVGADGHVVY